MKRCCGESLRFRSLVPILVTPATADRARRREGIAASSIVGVSDTTPPFALQERTGHTSATTSTWCARWRNGWPSPSRPFRCRAPSAIPMLQRRQARFRRDLDDADAASGCKRRRLQRHLLRHAARGDREKVERHHFGATARRQESVLGQHLDRRRQPEGGRRPSVEIVYVRDYALAFADAQGRQRRRVSHRRERAACNRAAGRPRPTIISSFRTSPSRATSASP